MIFLNFRNQSTIDQAHNQIITRCTAKLNADKERTNLHQSYFHDLQFCQVLPGIWSCRFRDILLKTRFLAQGNSRHGHRVEERNGVRRRNRKRNEAFLCERHPHRVIASDFFHSCKASTINWRLSETKTAFVDPWIQK